MAWAAYGNVPGKPGCKLDIRNSAGDGTEIDLKVPGSMADCESAGRFRLPHFRQKVGWGCKSAAVAGASQRGFREGSDS